MSFLPNSIASPTVTGWLKIEKKNKIQIHPTDCNCYRNGEKNRPKVAQVALYRMCYIAADHQWHTRRNISCGQKIPCIIIEWNGLLPSGLIFKVRYNQKWYYSVGSFFLIFDWKVFREEEPVNWPILPVNSSMNIWKITERQKINKMKGKKITKTRGRRTNISDLLRKSVAEIELRWEMCVCVCLIFGNNIWIDRVFEDIRIPNWKLFWIFLHIV